MTYDGVNKTIAVFDTIWKTLVQEKELLAAPDIAKVQKHLEAAENQAALAEAITVARSNKVRDSGIRRIQFECTHKQEELAKLLAKAILHYGGDEKEGAAPRGPRERRLRQFLDRRQEEEEY